MTRDRIIEVSKEAAIRVADPKLGTRTSTKYIERLAELKKQRDEQVAVEQRQRA